MFACTRHRRLLADRCPGCRQPALHLPAARGRLLPCARADGLHPAQCRNQIGRKTAGPTLRGSARVACGHRLDHSDADGTVDAAPTSAMGIVHDALIGLQQRILDLLDPAGPDHTTTFGMPTPVSRYFTDLRLLANVICATWPVARPLAVSNDLASELDAHVAERRDLIADMTQHKEMVARHTIYDRPPTGSAAAAGLLAIAERILAGHHHDALGELTDGPDGQRWAEHFIRAELHCSPGLVAAAAPHVARYRKRPPNGRLPAKPKTKRPKTKRATTPGQPKPLPSTSAGGRPAPQPVSPLPLRAAPRRYRAEHVPAFMPDDWYDRRFAHLRGVNPRLGGPPLSCWYSSPHPAGSPTPPNSSPSPTNRPATPTARSPPGYATPSTARHSSTPCTPSPTNSTPPPATPMGWSTTTAAARPSPAGASHPTTGNRSPTNSGDATATCVPSTGPTTANANVTVPPR